MPFDGMANGQSSENSLQPSPWLLGRSAGSKLVWKPHRVGVGFSVGVWVLLGWPSKALWLARALWPLHLQLQIQAPWEPGLLVFPAQQEALQSS